MKKSDELLATMRKVIEESNAAVTAPHENTEKTFTVSYHAEDTGLVVTEPTKTTLEQATIFYVLFIRYMAELIGMDADELLEPVMESVVITILTECFKNITLIEEEEAGNGN